MRLIDADALKTDLRRFYDNEVTAKRLIDEQPTIDAIPVEGGKIAMKYSEVIWNFKRMCRHYSGQKDERCPLNTSPKDYCRRTRIGSCRKQAFENSDFYKIIVDWAAKHPEPVYPTWFEWLEERRILTAAKSDGTETIFDTLLPTPAMFDSIPTDVAEALKIPPKEG